MVSKLWGMAAGLILSKIIVGMSLPRVSLPAACSTYLSYIMEIKVFRPKKDHVNKAAASEKTDRV